MSTEIVKVGLAELNTADTVEGGMYRNSVGCV
jgi:hypothetical protein